MPDEGEEDLVQEVVYELEGSRGEGGGPEVRDEGVGGVEGEEGRPEGCGRRSACDVACREEQGLTLHVESDRHLAGPERKGTNI